MSGSRQEDLRKNQKERTRTAIVDAAVSILRDGTMPTVQSAAEAARVSRATAYRYFPTQDSLITEVMSITPSADVVDKQLQEALTHDPETDVLAIVDLFNHAVLAEEPQYRAAMRLYQDLWLEFNAGAKASDDGRTPVRAGRRMRLIARATAPLKRQMPPATLRRMQNALALTVGIDSLTIMKDVCGIEDDAEVVAILRWTAEAIMAAAKAEVAKAAITAPPSPSPA